MNIFKFLTERTGAVNKAGLAGVVLAGGLAIYNLTGYMADSPAVQEGEIRSLAQVMASGGQMPSEYSGINISRGGVEFASAAEVSAQNDRLFDGGEGAINSMNAALDGFSAPRYALSKGEAGLGMGANAAVQRDGAAVTTGGVSIPGEAGVREGLRQANEAQAGKEEGPAGPTLKHASIAKASGSNLGVGGSGSFGAPSGRGVSSAAAERASRAGVVGAGSISGAMPDGSTLVASNSTLRGATSTSSSFRPGNVNAHMGRGRFSEEGKDLRRIAMASAKVAANANRATNEADQVFMSGERLAGGVQVDGSTMETEGTGASADFVDEMDTNIGNADTALDDIDTTEQERKNHRTRLQKGLFGTFFVAVAAMLSISALGNSPWDWVAKAAIAAIALGIIAVFMVDAGKYIHKYGWDGWSTASIIVGGVMAVGVVLSLALKGMSSWINKTITKPLMSKMGLQMLTSTKPLMSKMGLQMLTSAVLGTGVGMGIESTINSIKSFSSNNDAGDGLSSGSSDKK